MAQGIPFDKEEILETLKPYLQLGYSIHKASLFAGIESNVVYKWIDQDPTLSKKIQAWQNEISILARRNWRDRIQIDKDFNASRDWLERKDKDEFGKNLDITTDGEPITGNEIIFKDFSELNEDEQENSTDS